MKKALLLLAAAAWLISLMSVATLAGGHGHGHTARQTRYEHCAADGCGLVGAHKHGSTWYQGQSCERGTYRLCTADGCAAVGPHTHDGVRYCSQDCQLSDYAVCTAQNCAQTGLHAHDGVYYACAPHKTARGCGKGR